MKRRDLLKTLCAAGGASVAATALRAEEPGAVVGERDPVGVLVDTTSCLGCRMCEYACADANGLPTPEADVELTATRQTSPDQWSVVRRFETEKGPVTVKCQCLHCLQPACASACLTKAMVKTLEGPVIWRESKCMGCRYCMVSCPFDVPKFEYHSAVPKIQKCQLCFDRVQEGKEPACVANCPARCLTFGRRLELIDLAWSRIYGEPGRYVRHVYGEHEVGGTSWLYLSAVPFEQLGFRTDLGTTGYPVLTKEFLYAVPLVLTLVPPFLLALSRATRARDEGEEEYDDGGGA
jgi:Fe-S-cluster-containing dehydrogenase component